jgi:hypothetical protein
MLMGHVFGLQKHSMGSPDLKQLQGCWTDWGETCRAWVSVTLSKLQINVSTLEEPWKIYRILCNCAGTPFENCRGNYTIPLYLEFLGLSLCVR